MSSLIYRSHHIFAGTFPYFHTIPILRKGFQNRLILGSNEAGQSKSLKETPNIRGIALMADGRIRLLRNTDERFHEAVVSFDEMYLSKKMELHILINYTINISVQLSNSNSN